MAGPGTPDPGKEVPLTLGASLLEGQPPVSHFYSFRYDFQPASVQAATRGLYVEHPQREDPTKVMLIPALLDEAGAAQGHYSGVMEPAKPDADDLDCVLVYDGARWTLDALSGNTRVRFTKGEPPGYDLSEALQHIAQMDAPEAVGAFEQHAADLGPSTSSGAAAAAGSGGAGAGQALEGGQQPEGVDPDLDALLDGALWEQGDPSTTEPAPPAAGATGGGGGGADDTRVWEAFGGANGDGHARAGAGSTDDEDDAGAQVSDESDGLGAEMF